MPKEGYVRYFKKLIEDSSTSVSREKKRNRIRDAAILLVALGKDVASEVLKHLKEDEITQLTQEILKLKKIKPDETSEVIKDFMDRMKKKDFITKGGTDYVREVLKGAFGEEKAEEILQKTSKKDPKELFSFLNTVDPESLATALKGEHPQILAMIISNIKPKNAAMIIKNLPNEVRTEVIRRIATTQNLSPFVMEKLAYALQKKIEHIQKVQQEEIDGIKTTANILTYLDRESEDKILKEIEAFDKGLAESIRAKMFLFEDFRYLRDEYIREVLAYVDITTLAKALKASDVEIAEKFLKNLSKNKKKDLLSEMEILGPIRLKEIQEARREIVNIAKKLDREGIISLRDIKHKE